MSIEQQRKFIAILWHEARRQHSARGITSDGAEYYFQMLLDFFGVRIVCDLRPDADADAVLPADGAGIEDAGTATGHDGGA